MKRCTCFHRRKLNIHVISIIVKFACVAVGLYMYIGAKKNEPIEDENRNDLRARFTKTQEEYLPQCF